MPQAVVCLDLETTGLDVFTCEPIEIAMVEIEIARGMPRAGRYTERALPIGLSVAWDPAAFDMHRSSGLYDLVLDPTMTETERHVLMRQTEDSLVYWLEGCAGDTPIIPCGRSVGAFDLTILRRCMPRLARMFHHRTVDVGTLDTTAAVLGWRFTPPVQTVKPHRALADCLATIEQLALHQRGHAHVIR